MLLKSLFLRRKAALALAAALALGTAMPAQAFLGGGRIVFDPSNYSQNVLTAARTLEQINEVIGADTLGYLSTEHVVQLTKNAKCGFCTACFTGEYAVKPDEVLSTDIHERHLNDRPKDEKKLGE